jgi:hypothetical protein
MAFSKITLQKLAAITKLKEEDISNAAKDEKEIDLAVPEGELFSTADLTARDENKKQEGITIGKEMGAKEVKKAAGLDEKSSKDPAKIFENIKEKVLAEAKIPPSEQVTQLNEQISLLKKTLGEKDMEIESHKGVAVTAARDRKLLSFFPTNRANVLSDDEYLTLIKANLNFEEKDGVLQVKKDGVLLRDPKTQDPLTAKDAITGIFSERSGWLNGETGAGGLGRGGKDNQKPAGGFSKKSEVIAYYENQGVTLTGADAKKITDEIAKCAKEDSSFDMNS